MEVKNKLCPHCKKEIDSSATKCPYCQSDLRGFMHKRIGCGALILIIFITFIFIGIFSGNKNPSPAVAPSNTNPVSVEPSIKEITLTESQCQNLKDQFYSLMLQKPVNKTQLGKELLEQYAFDAGIPVKKSNPDVRYILPKSECGENLDTALDTIIIGEKNNGGL